MDDAYQPNPRAHLSRMTSSFIINMLPEGTIIRVGYNNPGVAKSARGLEFRINSDTHLDDGIGDMSEQATVTNNPSGWHTDVVHHTIDLAYDSIIGGPLASNKDKKDVLERYDA